MTKTRAKKETRNVVPRSTEGTRNKDYSAPSIHVLSYDKFNHRRDRLEWIQGETLCAQEAKVILCKENVTSARK